MEPENHNNTNTEEEQEEKEIQRYTIDQGEADEQAIYKREQDEKTPSDTEDNNL